MHYCIITTLCDLSKTNHCCEFWENKSKPFELNVWDCFSQAMPDSIILHKIWHSNSVVPKYWIIFYYYLYGVRPVGCVLCDKLGSRCNKCISCPIFCEGISNQWCFYSFYWNHMIILFWFPFFSPFKWFHSTTRCMHFLFVWFCTWIWFPHLLSSVPPSAVDVDPKGEALVQYWVVNADTV